METRPTVSVVINTYNHGKYISEAIESALMQETDFPFEIVIGDDESADGTREICKEYAAKYPEKIRLHLRSRKDVVYINGYPTGRNNFVQNVRSARGKYVALLPGDDYWTDRKKLQKQVDVLESNPGCVACHHWHRVTVKNEAGVFVEKPAPRQGEGYCSEQIADVRDIFANRVRLKSRTLMFRNVFSEGFDFPGWFHTVQFGDVALTMILGKFGQFYFIDDEMAVYRLTGTGVSTMGNQHHLFHYRHYIEWVRIWEKGDVWYNGKYRKEAVATILHFYELIFRKYKYSFGIFMRIMAFALFESRFSLLLRMQMAGSVRKHWAKNKGNR